ncbi:MAG: response regulator [Steroidobacteraceae bacterium]
MRPARPSATVLFVDDDERVTDALRRTVRAEHLDCLTAQSAGEALEILQRRPVDVLVSDEKMPTTTGSELLAIVRQRFPATIRIILSGQSDLDAAIRAINEGEVYRFLQKPCDPRDLAATIRDALQHKKIQDLSRKLLRRYRHRGRLLETIERRNPGIIRVATDDDGAIFVDEDDADIDMDELLRQLETAVAASADDRSPGP